MSGRERKVSPEEVQKVKILIEQYLSHYMKKNQVIDILYRQQNIEPLFTKLVWERLEEENQGFFQIYNVMLMLADQIRQCNDLLQKQYEYALSHEVNTPGVVVSNGSHIPALHDHNNASYYVPENNVGFNNFGPYNTLVGVGPNLNGIAPGYLGDVYQGHGNGMESQPPVSSVGIMDSVPNQLRTVIDFGQFLQFIRWSDSTADFTNVTGETDISRNFDFQRFHKDS